MKTYKQLLFIVFTIFVGSYALSQNLEAVIEAKNIYGNSFFKPIQAGESFSFKIKVKNKGDNTESLFINKDGSFEYPQWVEIPNNGKITIGKDQNAVYDVNVYVPGYIGDSKLPNRVDVYWRNANGQYVSTYISFSNFYFLIDNTPPTDVTIEQKNFFKNEVVVSVSGYDEMSRDYTVANYGTGQDGITKFNLKLKSLSGAIVATKETKAMDDWSHVSLKSTSIKGNTTYRAYVKAIDLAGNTSADTFVEFTTPADPPTNLHATDIKYYDFVLRWTASQGATEYRVYDVTDEEGLIGTTSETSLHIEGLDMGETRKYAIKSISEPGVSGYSEELTVTTLKPEIFGANTICDQETYVIENLLEGAVVQWSATGSAKLVSGQGTGVAIFTKTEDGSGSILVTISGFAKPIALRKEVWVGTPAGIARLTHPAIFGCTKGEIFIEDDIVADGYEWSVSSAVISSEGNTTNAYTFDNFIYVDPSDNNDLFTVRVRSKNKCSNSSWYVKQIPVFCDSGGGIVTPLSVSFKETLNIQGLLISPNGDGINDTWEIGTTEKSEKATIGLRNTSTIPFYNVTIFNTQGAIVYQKDNYMQDRERFYGVGNVGNYTDKILPDGVYLYSISGSTAGSGHLYIKRE